MDRLACKIVKTQQGVSLVVALIMLAGLMIGSVALIRSVDTATLVAGNLAFKHSATLGADRGIQTAVAWLEAKTTVQRQNSDASNGYCSSHHADDDTSGGWNPSVKWTAACTPVALTADAAGNRVDYLIHRLCKYPNAEPLATTASGPNLCSTSIGATGSSADTSSKQSSFFKVNGATANYIAYRITVRVQAERGTRSFVQTTVLLPK